MSIYAIGITHHTAPVTVREKIYFPVDKLALYLQDLLSRGIASEAVLISTCNRSELYCEANDSEALYAWFCAQTTLARHELEPVMHLYVDQDAISHMMEVASSLDSMILGESQILGQLKEAYSESCAAGAVGALFHRLFQHIFTVAKEIRTATAIGACPVSVASAAVHFAKQQFSQQEEIAFKQANISLIGAGDMTSLLLRYLNSQVEKPISVVNRNIDNAQSMSAYAYSLDKLTAVLAQTDIAFSATGSAVPLIHQDMMKEVMSLRGNKPIILIDIAVPRDIDAAVSELAQVNLYCIDDLKTIIETNRQGREHAALKAREMIKIKSMAFMRESQSLDKVSHTIRAYRGQIEAICHAELLKAKEQLNQGADPEYVLEVFAHAFAKKLMHAPSVQLRQAGEEGKFEILKLAKQLFAIPDAEVGRL